MNEVPICNANDPMPTGQGDIGTILLSPFEDGHYNYASFYLATSALKILDMVSPKGL